MSKAEVYLHGQLAGYLTQDEQGYTFAYAPAYLLTSTAEAVSLTLPLRAAPYVERTMRLPAVGAGRNHGHCPGFGDLGAQGIRIAGRISQYLPGQATA